MLSTFYLQDKHKNDIIFKVPENDKKWGTKTQFFSLPHSKRNMMSKKQILDALLQKKFLTHCYKKRIFLFKIVGHGLFQMCF